MTATQADKASLRAILAARTEALQTFQCDLVVMAGPGDEVHQLVQASLRYSDWIARNHPELDRQNEGFRARAERLAQAPTVTRRYRYFTNAAGQIRVERLPDPSNESAAAAQLISVCIYSDGQWKSYVEATNQRTSEREGDLTIQRIERENLCWHDIARGVGIHYGSSMQLGSLKFHVGSRPASVQVLDWNEVLENFPPELSREENSAPPGSSNPRPSLVLESKPFKETGKGLMRVQVWFAPEHGYALQALVVSDLQRGGRGTWNFLPRYSVDWSDPVDADAITPVFGKCLIRFYKNFSTPLEGVPQDQWPEAAYDHHHLQYEFSNVQIDAPLSDNLFEVKPVAGTHVVDESKGYLYVVGNAGEELQKTALSERARRPPEEVEAKRAVRWRIVLYAVNAVLLLVVLIVWFVMRRR